jgi:hypothetical protein
VGIFSGTRRALDAGGDTLASLNRLRILAAVTPIVHRAPVEGDGERR